MLTFSVHDKYTLALYNVNNHMMEVESMSIYGYIRVSTREQNEARQLAALSGLHIPSGNIHLDKQSGKNFDRPACCHLLRRLRSGDVLYIVSIDRLGRNYDDILEQWRIITKQKGADIVVLDFPLLDTRVRMEGQDLTGRFVADLVLQILAYVAQKERENIRQRQAEGIAAAKAAGRCWGNPGIERPAEADDYAILWREKKISLEEIGRRLGVSRSTAYRFVKFGEKSDGKFGKNDN